MNKVLVGIMVLIIGIGFFYFLGNSAFTARVIEENSKSNIDNVKTIKIDSSHLRFYIDDIENPDIVVKEGDKVKIEFSSQEGFHDWVVDAFGATERVSAGASTSIEFTANKIGTFEYYCSVGKHRANGMKGNFIVE
ncbi:MAG: cupredoxin domain-containing protein [Nanoarchaeota archaeon]